MASEQYLIQPNSEPDWRPDCSPTLSHAYILAAGASALCSTVLYAIRRQHFQAMECLYVTDYGLSNSCFSVGQLSTFEGLILFPTGIVLGLLMPDRQPRASKVMDFFCVFLLNLFRATGFRSPYNNISEKKRSPYKRPWALVFLSLQEQYITWLEKRRDLSEKERRKHKHTEPS